MSYVKSSSGNTGFTLVEVLIVMVIMGLVVTSVYSLFISSKRSANTSEEVVDVQQNLRVATEVLASDIRMAGFLIPADQAPISNAPDAFAADSDDDGVPDTPPFSLNTISATRTYARVLNEATDGTGLLVDDEMSPLFLAGNLVRVIRPTTREDMSAGEWTIGAIDADGRMPITSSGYVAGSVEAGDIVVRKLTGEPLVANIAYWLRATPGGGDNNFELVRDDDSTGGISVVASNIADIDLTYLMADGVEIDTTTDYKNIRAVRITISAETDNTKTGLANYSGVKRRSMQTLVKIRNFDSE